MPSSAPKSEPISNSNSRIAFDRFEVDLRSGELRRDGRRIRLQAQPFQLLALLIENAGEVVTRDEVCRALWQTDTFVDFDHSVAAAVSKIREALSDSAESPRFIETLPRKGYRFIGQIKRDLPQPAVLQTARELKRTATPLAKWPATWPKIAGWIGLSLVAMLVVGFAWLRWNPHPKAVPPLTSYLQLTNFGDAVFSPAISTDGRMIAFIRGQDASFPTVGEIYTKLLPNGEPVQRTNDGWPKYGVTFSPDGSRIAYTVAGNPSWHTETISALGGEPRLFLPNSAGLTWLDEEHVLFSEIKTGLHMGLVTSTYRRSELRDVYLPEHERGMAHYSYASPDRIWVLVVEMGGTGAWQRCRLVPLDGSSTGSQVGPPGACTSAAWSPDGKWMYFSAVVNGSSHLWRQLFPKGELEQITSGPTDEAGVAITPDGRSLVSAIGMAENGVWLHDTRGEHLISSEGYASLPTFSRDGRSVYYLLRRESPKSPSELWMTDLESRKSEPLVQGFSIMSYNVSPDGKEAIFASLPESGRSQIWLASCDHGFAPRLLASSGENTPFLGFGDDVIFSMSEGRSNYLFRMKKDGSGRTKIMEGPITNFMGISPDGRWAVAVVPVNEQPTTAMIAAPIQGGDVKRICPAYCMAKWSPDGTRFYVEPFLQGTRGGRAVAIPVPRGRSLPDLPAWGVRSAGDSVALPGSKVVDLSSFDPSRVGVNVAPGLAADSFIYTKTGVHRNLFEIPLP